MKKFKQFLREEDAMASTNKTGEQGYKATSFSGKSEIIPPAELPPGHPLSHQHGPPSPRPPEPPPFEQLDQDINFDTWDDYLRWLEQWFMWQHEYGFFDDLNWSQEQLDKWWNDFLERHKRIFDYWQQEHEENPLEDEGHEMA